MNHSHSIFVLDFGGQYAHLIANRIRRCGAYSEIVPSNISAKELKEKKPAGIIFSGGPHSVFENNSPQADPDILELGIPILGICYGHQLIATIYDGEVTGADTQEFGKAELQSATNNKEYSIMKGIPSGAIMWMNHGDEVTKVPSGFEIISSSEDCEIALMGNTKKHIYGAQFHPEVTHSEYGMQFLENFVEICGAKGSWTIGNFIEEEIEKIQEQCKGKKVFLLVSGGVDSSVCFALLTKALGKDRVFGCLVDHGMMRLNEAEEVKKMLSDAGFNDLHVEYAAQKFLKSLQGVFSPEEKRIKIGEDFLNLQAEITERMNLNPDEWILGQGTIYPDTIESGGSKHASKIKTHHNRVERIEKMIEEGKVIEPIAELYKDEVREVGRELGLGNTLISRHPFPGPGLGVRVLCTEKEDLLKDATEREKRIQKKYPEFEARVLPIRSVGVQGDSRSYRHPVVLFSESGNFSFTKIGKIATEISNNDPELNRVLVNLFAEKAPDENFSVQRSEMTTERISLLQKADSIVRKSIAGRKDCEHIWQFPVVLAPVGIGGESIILRPIESENAMTAVAAELPDEVLAKIIARIESEIPEIDFIFYDLTGKPPGTIEWE